MGGNNINNINKMGNIISIRVMEFFSSFLRYLLVGVIKTTTLLFLLWLFIDYFAVTHRMLWRLGIVGIIFVATFFLYHVLGFAK